MNLATLVRRCAGSLLLSAASLPALGGSLVPDHVKSAALGRDMGLTVYLPDVYKEASARLPVVYLLHGAGGNENDWARNGGVVETLDGLIRRGLMRPTLVVMPSAGPDSWWVDGNEAKAESALMNDLLPYVEGHYRVGTERRARAVAGLSMGGYGSLNLALRYPTRFCAAGIISAAIYDPQPPDNSAARRAAQFTRNGRFDAEVWKALNYPARLDGYLAQNVRVPMWIVSGDQDYLGTVVSSVNLYWRIIKIQPQAVELRVVDGDHDWGTFRTALPDTLQYLDRQCAKTP